MVILGLLFENQDISALYQKLLSSNHILIVGSIVLAMISHWVRAYRWRMLINPLGYRVSTSRTFLAVMVGYVANLVFPRMGEVAKCGVLNKLENVPVTKSFGTVVVERIIDLMMLITLLSMTFILEYKLIKSFMLDWISSIYEKIQDAQFLLLILGGFLVIGVAFIVWLFKKENSTIALKAKAFLKELIEGLLSVRKIENQLMFWLSTIMIWILYYAMSYIVVFAMPETAGLSMVAGLAILSMGSIGMTAPVQGGIGAYHFMVSSILVLYGIDYEDGLAFATILHAAQTLGVIVVGSISLIVVSLIGRKNNYG